MSSAFREAIHLILSGNSTLLNIIGVTLRMSLTSSLLALLIGVPLGALLGCSKFPGKKIIVILTRTMIGLPPVVCGLLCYLMFCGVGPLRHLHLLYTVYKDLDVIVKSARIVNWGDAPIVLSRALSAQLKLSLDSCEVLTLHGSWARERAITRQELKTGAVSSI